MAGCCGPNELGDGLGEWTHAGEPEEGHHEDNPTEGWITNRVIRPGARRAGGEAKVWRRPTDPETDQWAPGVCVREVAPVTVNDGRAAAKANEQQPSREAGDRATSSISPTPRVLASSRRNRRRVRNFEGFLSNVNRGRVSRDRKSVV